MWLSAPDPSTNQNIASDRHHGGTGSWVFQESHFVEWSSKSDTPLLWIHGKRAPLCSLQLPVLTNSNHHSRCGKECPLVRRHLSVQSSSNLYCQLAPQLSKI